jgi:hypothetical protein
MQLVRQNAEGEIIDACVVKVKLIELKQGFPGSNNVWVNTQSTAT